MTRTRREFVALATAMGAGLAFGCATPPPRVAWRERRDLYPQGVASGDPTQDSVILWTRRAPDTGARSHRLLVEVAEDAAFERVVARGELEVGEATDWTCRFVAVGLRPAREYWYRFTDEAGNGSRIGRTLTAPAEGDDRPVRFAFVSCQDVTQGACNAYRRMIFEDARRPRAEQLGFVLHLGDFIYEVVWYPEDCPDGRKGSRRVRDVVRYPDGEKMRDFHLPTSLADYRAAYKGYLQDPDLQDARARWPFVPVWDNHEFSWHGYQSQQFFGEARPAQTIKVAANQAWYEYQPARVVKAGAGDAFVAPEVSNAALDALDERGVGHEANNLAAIGSLKITRALRFGKNVDLLLTDNRSWMAPPYGGGEFAPNGFPFFAPAEAIEMLDRGRAHGDGHPPATLLYGGEDLPNPQVGEPPQAYLGLEQMAWLKEKLRTSRAPWKIWGHSFGTLTWRTDVHNLPGDLGAAWPGAGYGVLNAGNFTEHDELFDMIRAERIAGFAIVAGDKHSFWAGMPSKRLPPEEFDPVGVEFVTGSISSPGLAEGGAGAIPPGHPLRALYVHDVPDGTKQFALTMTILHGVRASLALRETGDPARARAARNPEVSPHLRFADFGGHGYATVRASASELETEFVCIPRPMERSETEDGGPLVYRVIHRTPLWRAGERPQMTQEIVEGDPGLAV